MTQGKSNTLKSSHVRFGRRTYFFDVVVGRNKKNYLKITESKFMGEGQKRAYNSFLLFPEDLADFQSNLKEAAGSLG